MRMDDFQRQLREERERMRQEYNEEIDRLRSESERRWRESQVREKTLEQALDKAEERARDAVGAAKVVAEQRAAEVRAEFAQQERETQKLREDFNKKHEMWQALQERLADFEQREAQKNELNEHMNEEIRKLQAAQAELRREFATLEATAQNAHSEADKSDLQRQLEATEVRLETLVHVDERHDQRYEQAIEGEGQAAETTSDWASDANGAHRSQTGQSEMGNGQEPPGTSATADTSRRVLVGAPAEHLGTELLPETSNTVKDEL